MTTRTTESAVVTRLDSGVVVFAPLPGVRIGLTLARENTAAIEQVAGEGPIRLLARLQGIIRMDREARVYSSRWSENRCIATAMVVGGSMSRMLAAFFLGLNRPRTPTRAFSDETSAIAWLLAHEGELSECA